MSIIKLIFSKQFIAVFIVWYIIYYYEKPREVFNSILERHGLDKLIQLLKEYYYNVKKQIEDKLEEISSKNSKKNTSTKKEATSESEDSEESSESSESYEEDPNNDMFCNKKNSYNLDYLQMGCLLTEKNNSLNILKANNAIPYNYENNLDNSVLYTINPKYTKEKLVHETKLADKVAAKNERIIHTNFDKNIDTYKISNRVDCLQNTDRRYIKNNKYKPCFAVKPDNIPKSLKLFTRVSESDVVLNWNIPILPLGFYPNKIVLEISKSKSKSKSNSSDTEPDMYEFDYKNEPCEIENDLFKINTFKIDNRMMYTLKSDRTKWWNKSVRCFTIYSKVYFFFSYYDTNKNLKDCFIESNESSFYKN
jgi:hypothetical protein